MRGYRFRRPKWLRLAPIALILGLTNGTPSFANDVSGDARGRVIVYFHQAQGYDGVANPICRRQMQEETAGFEWTDKYAWDPPELEASNDPLSPNRSFEYQRPSWRSGPAPGGDNMRAYAYTGTYRIATEQFGPAPVTSTLRVITYNNPTGSYTGPECSVPGPAPIVDGRVEGVHGGKRLLCRYYDGVWDRQGPSPIIELHGTCSITSSSDPQRVVMAAVKETRRLFPAPDCQPVRPGTGLPGVGDCPYTMEAEVTSDH